MIRTSVRKHRCDSLPFKGRAGVGMGLENHQEPQSNPIPHPASPLKGEVPSTFWRDGVLFFGGCQ